MWIEVDGGHLFAAVRGEGPPLLLVHGWPLDHRIFEPQIDALAADFQVCAFDRRGFGRSTAAADLHLEVDDIDTLLEALGWPDTHLLGMSQGGRVALRYATCHPGRLRSLILQGAVVDGLSVPEPDADRIPIADYVALARQGRLAEVRRRWLDHPMMSTHGCSKHSIALVRAIVEDYAGQDLVDFESDKYRFDGDVPGALAKLEAPVLVITGAGETDARKRHAAEILARAERGCELVLERSGHLSNLSEPDAYTEAVRTFCAGVEAGRQPVLSPSE